MTKARVSNRDSHIYVERRREFKANNLWSEWVDDAARYVVYSYDRHWPLFIYEARTNMWFENTSKYSVTTAKHHTQSHPHTDTTPLHVDDMLKVKSYGCIGLITGAGVVV